MTRSTLLLAGFALALSFSPLQSQTPERFTIGGDRVAIYDLVGSVTVAPGSGNEVVVEVTRRGPDAKDLRVETHPVRGGQTLAIVFPGDRIIYRGEHWEGQNQLYVREDGTFGGDRGDGRGRSVRIQSSGSGLEAHAVLRVMIPTGKQASIYIGVGEIQASNVDGDIVLDSGSGNITAEGMKGKLSVDTGSGNVVITGAAGTSLSIDTGSGDVQITGATSTDVLVDTGSGNVTGSDISASDLSVDTGSGNIRLIGVRASRLSMDTGSGDVEISLLSDADDISVDTGSGSVTIAVPSSFGSTVDLSTSSGDVETDIDIQVTRRGRQSLTGRIGDGQGRLTVETGSGDVTIRGSR